MKTKLKLALAASAAVVLAVSVAPALAGKGGAKGAAGSAASAGSSIALNPTATAPALGSPVTFTTSATGLQGAEYPMVYVECYSTVDNVLLYGQLDHPTDTFVLGGGSSLWWEQRDDARCVAHLYAYGGKSDGVETIRELATPAQFAATA